MSSSNCCFLTCIQVSQEAGQVVCYSHLFKKFPQFIVIHTVKGYLTEYPKSDFFLQLFGYSPSLRHNMLPKSLPDYLLHSISPSNQSDLSKVWTR